ncbi:MAG TPA: hypothetical protein VMV61_09270 [Patescibacteria group bacterium]|nr:hypothetical protein [Patescibacteria group bacterium]
MAQWRSFVIAGLVSSCLLLLPHAVRGQSPPAAAPETDTEAPAYNGDWWLTLGGWEQYGVVSGYEDCYGSEYRGSVPFPKEVQVYVDELNQYFLADAARRKRTVSEALDALRGAAEDKSIPRPDEPAGAAHGGFDGKFWFDADPAAELGFVEGYLACHTAKVKDADGKFSKAPAEYVDLINKAYNITDDTDDIDEDRAPLKIADVLHTLKDEAAAASKPGA